MKNISVILAILFFAYLAKASDACVVLGLSTYNQAPSITCTDKTAENIKLPTFEDAGRNGALQQVQVIKVMEDNSYQFRSQSEGYLNFVKK